jgi:integrase
MTSPLKVLPTQADESDPYERIYRRLQPKFLSDTYVPCPDDAALWGRTCSVRACTGWDSHGTPPLCARHRHRLHYARVAMTNSAGEGRGGDLTRERFVDDTSLNGGPVEVNDHPGFDFRGLPRRLDLELRLFVQHRSEQRATSLRLHEFNAIRKILDHSGLQSLMLARLPPEQRWLRTLPIPDAFATASGQVQAHVRFAISVCADAGWPVDLMNRDRWYEHDFDSRGSRVKTITWTGITQSWLKAWAKRWVTYRLAAGWRFSTGVSHAGRLLAFSRFVAAVYPAMTGPQDISRETLLDYVAWIKRQPDIAASQRQALVSTVRVLIEDHRLNDWHPRIPETAVLRAGELPKREEMVPRPIDDFLLRQIMSEDNLTQTRPDLRTMLLIFDGHGLRIGSVVELEIDCLGEDADGFPTLRYRNTKRARERLHPIRNPAIVDVIREQQRRAQTRHPNTPWLFPSIMANPDGDRHTTSSAARLAIYEYIERINLHQRDGSRAHITPHQFRHTFGTRELNNGASQEVVQELLDHDDSKITRGYARLTERKLREEFIAAARFNVHGERLELLAPDSPLADIAWMKERLNRARVTLPNGYCSLPLQQTCEVQNACLDCTDYFVTTAEFLPEHEAQRARTAELIQTAEANGQTRIAEKNRVVLVKLDTLIASLRDAS